MNADQEAIDHRRDPEYAKVFMIYPRPGVLGVSAVSSSSALIRGGQNHCR
jgi:hypothetical protein